MDQQFVYVLSLISVDHGSNYAPDQSTVGVYSSKDVAAEAAGSISTDYGTFDDAIDSGSFRDIIDNRENPPDSGCLLKIGSDQEGEGDWVQLKIQAFPVQAGTARTRETKRKATVKESRCTKKKRSEKSFKGAQHSTKMDENALMARMKNDMEQSEYKKVSSQLRDMARDVEDEATRLRSTTEYIFSTNPVEPENLFEKSVGHFWGMASTRPYMRARAALADEIHDKVAVKHDTKEAWEAVLWHYQEMLRLCSGDNMGLRNRFPFLLMRLSRDDDAFNFIRYWCQDHDAVYEIREQVHAESKEGEWLYGHQTDCRFLDIFQECPKGSFDYISLALVVALATIKMRIVATTKKGFQQAAQRVQLDRLLDVVQRRNETILPALVNHKPLLSQPDPMYLSRGSPAECHHIVKDSACFWATIPGALDVLQARVGRKPKYSTDMST